MASYYTPPHSRSRDQNYQQQQSRHVHGSGGGGQGTQSNATNRHQYYQQHSSSNSTTTSATPITPASAAVNKPEVPTTTTPTSSSSIQSQLQSQQSMPTYEAILNKTLLFFVEKLVERSPRTLHDLSCQFGSPGFTKEMRAIVGNSQHGLKKFLSLHPYIFTINPDDTVMYTPLTGGGGNNNNNNDSPSSSSSGGASSTLENNNTEAVNGPLDKDTLQAIEYFQKRLLQYGSNVRVPIKSLQGHRSQAPLVIRHVTGQQLETFINFLKKHNSVFTVENEFVYLVSNNNNNNNNENNNSTTAFKELINENYGHHQIDTEKISRLIRFVQCTIDENGPMLVEQLFHRIAVQFETTTEESDIQIFKTPNDLATFLKMQNVFQVNSNLVTLTFVPQQLQQPVSTNRLLSLRPLESKPAMTGKVSSDLSSAGGKLPARNIPQSVQPPETFQQHKPKSGLGGSSAAAAPTAQQQGRSRPQRNFVNNVILQTINSNTTELPSDNIVIISNIRKGRQIVDSKLITSQAVGLDCEGVNLGPEGQITLIQIGTSTNMIYIFDMLVEGMNDVLKAVIESETIVKVMHDCRNDSVNLHNQYAINLTNVFDTQIAYMITKSKKNISLNSLCAELNLEGNTLKDKVKSIYRHDPQYWLRRPLTKQMLNYASSDVTSLLQIYAELNPLINNNNDNDNVNARELFNEYCMEQINILIQPNEIRQQKRLRKNKQDAHIVAEKFKTCKPNELSLSNREIRLVKYLNLPPETIQQLPLKIYKKLSKSQPNHEQSAQLALDSSGGGGISAHSDNEFNSLEPCSLDSLISSIDFFLEANRKNSAAAAAIMMTNDNTANNDHEFFGDSNDAIINSTTTTFGLDNNQLLLQSASAGSKTTCEVATQTISTGDIALASIYVEEEDEKKEKKGNNEYNC